MQCVYALLADTVNETKEGKLNILGVFDKIWVKNFPAKHREMVFIAGIEGVFADVGEHEVALHIVEAGTDDEIMSPMKLPKLQMKPRGPNQHPRARMIVQIGGMPLPRAGNFELRLRVDGVLLAAVPLDVVKLEQG